MSQRLVHRLSKAQLFAMVGYEIYADEVLRYHQSEAYWRATVSPARTSKSYSAALDKLWHVFPEFVVHVDCRCDACDRRRHDQGSEGGRVVTFPNGDLPGWSQQSSLGWVVAPHFSLCKEFQYLWDILVQNRQRYGFEYKVTKRVNNPDQGNLRFTIEFGRDEQDRVVQSTVEGKSATNETDLQAEEVTWCIQSEAAEQPEKILTKYLETRCLYIDFPTTPKISARWLQERIEQAKTHPELGMESFDFNPTCNPLYNWDRYWSAHQKAESRQLSGVIETQPPEEWHDLPLRERQDNLKTLALEHCFVEGSECPAMRDPEFGEQFGGRWTFDAERALPFRWEGDGSHVWKGSLPDWFEDAPKFGSTDYGYDHPSALGWFAVGPSDEVILYREHKERRLTPYDFVQKFVEMTPPEERPEYVVGDPQNPSVRQHFARLGLPLAAMSPVKMRDRKLGHMNFCDYLSTDTRTNRAKFYVHESCKHTIEELMLLRIKPGAMDEYSKASMKGADDLYDMIRYFLMTKPRGRSESSARREIDRLRKDNLRTARRNRRYLRSGYQEAVGRVPQMTGRSPRTWS